MKLHTLGIALAVAATVSLPATAQTRPLPGTNPIQRVPIGAPVNTAPAPRPPTAPPPVAPAPVAPQPGGNPGVNPGSSPASNFTVGGTVAFESALLAPNGVRQFLTNTQRSVGFPFANNYVFSYEYMREFAATFNLDPGNTGTFTGTNYGSFDVQNGKLLLTGFGVWTKLKDQKGRTVYLKYFVRPFEVNLTANSNLTRYDVAYQNWQTAVDRPVQNLNGAMAQLTSQAQGELVGRFQQMQSQRPEYRILATSSTERLRADIVWTSFRVEHFPEEIKNLPQGYVDIRDVQNYLKSAGFPE
ncbi:MAG: hypothetical protein K1Y36_30070, partial [Blastocatellia bacterium]|nr:hypothetical protein [Blastocatellia bacterium]